jgi:hypothetical protein
MRAWFSLLLSFPNVPLESSSIDWWYCQRLAGGAAIFPVRQADDASVCPAEPA